MWTRCFFHWNQNICAISIYFFIAHPYICSYICSICLFVQYVCLSICLSIANPFQLNLFANKTFIQCKLDVSLLKSRHWFFSHIAFVYCISFLLNLIFHTPLQLVSFPLSCSSLFLIAFPKILSNPFSMGLDMIMIGFCVLIAIWLAFIGVCSFFFSFRPFYCGSF